MQVASKIIAGRTLVEFFYPDSQTGEMTKRIGRVESFTSTGFKLFIGKGKYKSFAEDKIRDLKIIGG
jgi:hypothetical protein